MSIATPGELGALARFARKSNGWTLKETSRRTGRSIRFLSEFERGKVTTEVGKALQVLGVLGVTLHADAETAATPSPVAPVAPVAASPPAADLPPRPAGSSDAARIWDMLRVNLELQAVIAAWPSLQDGAAGIAARHALCRCVDLLGEAARRVTPGTQARLPTVPWRALIARRNSLVMDYEKADTGALLAAMQAELPGLEPALRAALSRCLAGS